MEEKTTSYVLAFRGDIRDIATLVHIYEDRYNIRVRSKSTIVRYAVEDYVGLLCRNLKIGKFKTVHEAKAFLSQRNLLEFSKSRSHLHTAMQDESKSLDAVDLERDERLLPDNILDYVNDPETIKRAEELHQEKKGGDDADD